jgi:GntR family transcriptional regulator, rspAB operon transcriptional repressor
MPGKGELVGCRHSGENVQVNQALPTVALRAGSAHGSVRAQAHAILREAIVSLRLPPGHPVSENELAAQLGVSRTPVREAIIRLAGEGLVEVYPQRGSAVSRISQREVREAQFIREALERATLANAAERLDAGGASQLDAILAEQRAAHTTGDVARFLAADDALHRSLTEVGGHHQVWPVIHSAKGHLDRVRWLSLPTPAMIEQLIVEHSAIVAALGRGDLASADRQLTAHLRRVLEQLPRLAAEHPELFLTGELQPA